MAVANMAAPKGKKEERAGAECYSGERGAFPFRLVAIFGGSKAYPRDMHL